MARQRLRLHPEFLQRLSGAVLLAAILLCVFGLVLLAASRPPGPRSPAGFGPGWDCTYAGDHAVCGPRAPAAPPKPPPPPPAGPEPAWLPGGITPPPRETAP